MSETWAQQQSRLERKVQDPALWQQILPEDRAAIKAALARIDELERWVDAAGLKLEPIHPAFRGIFDE